MIDVLESYCCKWNMLVNLIKTKIMVFRRGGVLRKNEQWFYKGEKLKLFLDINIWVYFSPQN